MYVIHFRSYPYRLLGIIRDAHDQKIQWSTPLAKFKGYIEITYHNFYQEMPPFTNMWTYNVFLIYHSRKYHSYIYIYGIVDEVSEFVFSRTLKEKHHTASSMNLS